MTAKKQTKVAFPDLTTEELADVCRSLEVHKHALHVRLDTGKDTMGRKLSSWAYADAEQEYARLNRLSMRLRRAWNVRLDLGV